jgi:murein DD-endopeptidase MepM/ murein hydrolase activator NlpD
MRKQALASVICGLVVVTQIHGQQVEVPRDKSSKVGEQQKRVAGQPIVEIRGQPVVNAQPAKSVSAALTIDEMRQAGRLAAEQMKEEIHEIEPTATVPARVAQTNKKASSTASLPVDRQSRDVEPTLPQPVSFSGQTALVKLADGFDLPVGKPDGQGYYKARGFHSNGHLGEDWDGVGGGDTDLGDPIYCVGDGVVVFARDCHQGWGNVVIVRHSYREGGAVRNIDSLYGHLQKILVHSGQAVRRGQQIATLGNAHGLYDAHLHLEIRKNLTIGMSRDKFAKDLSNYYDPSQFILSHRHLQSGGASSRVAMNTFIYDAKIPWDKLRNYSHAHTGGGSSESAYALKKAVASQSTTTR